MLRQPRASHFNCDEIPNLSKFSSPNISTRPAPQQTYMYVYWRYRVPSLRSSFREKGERFFVGNTECLPRGLTKLRPTTNSFRRCRTRVIGSTNARERTICNILLCRLEEVYVFSKGTPSWEIHNFQFLQRTCARTLCSFHLDLLENDQICGFCFERSFQKICRPPSEVPLHPDFFIDKGMSFQAGQSTKRTLAKDTRDDVEKQVLRHWRRS